MAWIGGQYTIGSGVDIPLEGWVNIPCVDNQYTMGRGIDMPWVGRSICHG